jgi:asparaginyl-tRNA synthetase
MRVDITELTPEFIDKKIEIAGHVEFARGDPDRVFFVGLVDCGHGHESPLQLVFDAEARGQSAPKISKGATLHVVGTLVKGKAKEPVELEVEDIKYYGEVADPAKYPFASRAGTMRYFRDHSHLEAKTAVKGSIYTIRSHMFHLWSLYFMSKSWTLCHPPMLTSSECESGCQPFGFTLLTAPGKAHLPETVDESGKPTGQIDWRQDFFKGKRFMSVSYQLELEESLAVMTGKRPAGVSTIASRMLEAASSIYPLDATLQKGVYSLGFTGRGEPSDSTDHLALFQMGEIEIPFVDSSKPVIDVSEELIKFICWGVLAEYRTTLEFLAKQTQLGFDKDRPSKLEGWISKPFVRIPHADAITLMLKSKHSFAAKPAYDDDLTREQELWLTKHFDAFVVVTKFPKDIKSFYMPVVQETEEESHGIEHVDCFDILAPELGEIVGGSRRIHDPVELKARIQERGMDPAPLARYIALRETGCAKSGGMGLGLERLLKYIVGAPSVRDVISHPSYYKSGDV